MRHPDNYLEALRHLLGIEAGPTNYAWDPGGRTAFGIAEQYWPEYWADGPLTFDDAKDFYLVEFWRPLRLSALRDQTLRMEVFEASVVCGRWEGAKFTQSAYNLLRPDEWLPLVVDGLIGPKTVRALNRMASRYLDSLLAGCNFFQAQYFVNMHHEVRRNALRGWFGKRLRHPIKASVVAIPNPACPVCRGEGV